MALTSQEIKNYIESVKYDPVAIAQAAGKFNVSMDDIASAMGYNTGQVVDYLKTGLQNAGMNVYFEGGEQQGEAGSTYTPMTISSFSKPVDGSKRKYEAFSADMQSRGIVDNGSLASQMLSDLGPVLAMAVPFAGGQLASTLGVSAATGTALVNAGLQVAQGADGASILKGLATSQLSQAISPMVASELQNLVSDPATSKLITNIGSTVVGNVLSGNTSNLGKTILGSAVDTIVGEQTGNPVLGNLAGAAVTGGGQGAASTLAGIATSSPQIQNIETYPETTGPSIFAGQPDTSSITAPTDTQSLSGIFGNSNQLITDAPFVAATETAPTTQTAATTTLDYSGQPFGNAFSSARANGDAVFNWNGKAYNTNLAAATTGAASSVSPPVDINDISASPLGTKNKATATGTGPYASMVGTFKQAPSDQVSKFSNVAAPGTVDGRSLNLPTFDIGNSGENYITRFIKAAETGGFMNPAWGLYKPGVQIMASQQPNTTNYEAGTAAYVPVRDYPGTAGTIMLTDPSRYTPSQAANLLSHELVHVNQPLGTLNDASNYFRKGMSNNITGVIPYLQKQYGYWGGYDDAKNAPELKERMADLQGFQFNQGVDFAKDPVFKEKVLKDPHAAAMWNANTIERSTRLDPRDLPPGQITSSDYPKGSVPWGAKLSDTFQNFLNPNRTVNQPLKVGFAKGGIAELEKGMDFSSPQDTMTTNSSQGTDMATAPQAANPFSDPNTMAVYDQMRQSVSPKEFGDQMLAGAAQAAPEEVAAFRSALEQIEMPPEALDLLNNMVDEILANPEQYAEIRAKYKEMGAPDEILPEQFDPQFFAALNMAVDQMIGAPAGAQAFAKGGIAELTPVSKAIADYGRNGDTMLAHITPAEARMLRRKGGSGTINPKTGLPEFFNLFKEIGNAFKSIGRAVKSFASSTVGRIVTTVALGFFLGPAAASFIGATSPAAIMAVQGFIGSAGSTLLAGGSVGDALKAGAVGGFTAGATAGFMGTDAFAPGAETTPGQAFQAQLDKVGGNVFSAPTTAAPAEIPVETRTPMMSDETWANQPAVDKRIAAPSFTETPVNANEQVYRNPAAPPATTAVPAATPATAPPQGFNYAENNPLLSPEQRTAGLSAEPTRTFGPTPTVGMPAASTTMPAANTATVSGVEPPTVPTLGTAFENIGKGLGIGEGNSFNMTDLMKGGEQLFSPGLSTEQLRATPEYADAMSKGKTMGEALKEAAKVHTPGIIRSYGPATLAGLGTLGLMGGFSPKPLQESAQSKMLKGGPGSAEALMRDNPYRFYVQNMPGVQYYNGSLMKPPGMATGGIVDAMPMNYAIGGGVDKQLYDVYTSTTLSEPQKAAKLNEIITTNKVTADEIKTRFNLSDKDISYIDNSVGVNYAAPVQNSGGITTVLNPSGEAYSASDTAMYNAFRSGDYGLLNGLMATYSVTPAYIKTKFGLTDADINYITGQGAKFATAGPSTIKNTGTGTSTTFSSTPGFSMTPGGLKTMPKTTLGGTQMGTGTGVFPAIDDLQLAAGMDANNISPQKMSVASGLGLPEVQTRYWNAKNEAILGNYRVNPETGARTPIAAPAAVKQPYNNAAGLSSGLSPTGPLGEYSTRAVAPVVPDNPITAKGTLPNVSFNRTDIQQRMPMIPADYPPTGTASAKLMNMGGIAGLAQGGYPRRNGQIDGPGTATSDSIPAMLSDGEFVMTAKAVRGAGKGDRRAGAKRMYALMHQLEQNAARG